MKFKKHSKSICQKYEHLKEKVEKFFGFVGQATHQPNASVFDKLEMLLNNELSYALHLEEPPT